MSDLEIGVNYFPIKEHEADIHRENIKFYLARSIFATLIARNLFPDEKETFIKERNRLYGGDMAMADKAINQYGPRVKQALMEIRTKMKD